MNPTPTTRRRPADDKPDNGGIRQLRLAVTREVQREYSYDRGADIIKLKVTTIRPDKVERLREWLAEGMRRADEVRQTFADEGVTHEVGFILETVDGPVLVYAVESADYEAALRAFAKSPHPIDHEHKAVMTEVTERDVTPPSLLDISI